MYYKIEDTLLDISYRLNELQAEQLVRENGGLFSPGSTIEINGYVITPIAKKVEEKELPFAVGCLLAVAFGAIIWWGLILLFSL